MCVKAFKPPVCSGGFFVVYYINVTKLLIYSRGGYYPPAWWMFLFNRFLMKRWWVVYNLNAQRSIVCIAHERENTVLPYIMTFSLRILYDVIITKKFNHYLSDAFWYDILKSNVNFYNIHKNALKLKIILLTIANIKVYNRVDR